MSSLYKTVQLWKVGWLEEVCHLGQALSFKISGAIPSVFSLSPNLESRCKRSAVSVTMPLFCHNGLEPSETTHKINILPLSCDPRYFCNSKECLFFRETAC